MCCTGILDVSQVGSDVHWYYTKVWGFFKVIGPLNSWKENSNKKLGKTELLETNTLNCIWKIMSLILISWGAAPNLCLGFSKSWVVSLSWEDTQRDKPCLSMTLTASLSSSPHLSDGGAPADELHCAVLFPKSPGIFSRTDWFAKPGVLKNTVTHRGGDMVGHNSLNYAAFFTSTEATLFRNCSTVG